MVTSAHDRLQLSFAGALEAAGLASWTGGVSGSTRWLVKKFGDVYIHETVISHIRRLLDDEFACQKLGESPQHFAARMLKIQGYMNSPAFAGKVGGGLEALAADLRPRCQKVVQLKGQRIPK